MLEILLFTALACCPLAGPQEDADEPLTVKELVRALRDEEDAEARSMILLLLANHAIEDPKQERAAWEGVAVGLEDENVSVRREAVRLLALAPDREVAVKSLAEALATVQEDARTGNNLRNFWRSQRGGAERGRGDEGGRGGARRGGAEQEEDGESEEEEGGTKDEESRSDDEAEEKDSRESSEREDARAAAVDRFRSAAGANVAYVNELIEAISSLPDDRSIRAMMKFFENAEGRTLGRYRIAAARALGTLGSRTTIEAVRKGLEERLRSDAQTAKEAEKAEQSGRGGERGGRRGGRNGLGDLLGMLEEFGGDTADDGAKIYHEILVSAATKLKLEGMPAYDEDVSKNWKKWLGKNKWDFPAKLGKIKHLSEDE